MSDTRRHRPRLGLLLPTGSAPNAHEIVDRAREAEAAGFDSVWVIEDYYSWECFATLGFIAASTKQITLGVSVTTPYIRPTALLASAAATLDRFANGRFVLGIGRSTTALLRQVGIADRAPLAMLTETVPALRRLWTGAAITYHGKVVELDRVVLEVTPPRGQIPIYLGVIGPQGLRLAGRVGDGLILSSFCPIPYVRWAVQQVHAGAMDAGRPPATIDVAAIVKMRVSDDPSTELDGLKPRLALAYALPGRGELLLSQSDVDPTILAPMRAALRIDEIIDDGLEPYHHALASVRPEAVAGAVPTHLVEAAAMVGNAEQCRARLGEYVAAGVTHIIVDSPQPVAHLIAALRG